MGDRTGHNRDYCLSGFTKRGIYYMGWEYYESICDYVEKNLNFKLTYTQIQPPGHR